MADRPVERIVRDLGVPDLVEKLGTLQASDLQSLLLEVYSRQAQRLTPKQVLDQHRSSRFVRPAENDPRRALELDQRAFSLLPDGYVPLELSPLAPLGTCSALATVSQNKVVSTSRNTEVTSDATNVLALEAAVRRKAGADVVKLAASHRLVRAQALSNPHHRAHFRLFHLVAAGRGKDFEQKALEEQHAFYRLLVPGVRIAPHDPGTYYLHSRFKLYLGDLEVGDGGFTAWTQKLLSDTKERLLVSAVATERLAQSPAGSS
jgi:hypothetical protein